jgi:hypothetical protein
MVLCRENAPLAGVVSSGTGREEPSASGTVFLGNEVHSILDTVQSLSLLTVAEISGPILLAAALIYGIARTRRRRTRQPAPTPGTVYAQDK